MNPPSRSTSTVNRSPVRRRSDIQEAEHEKNLYLIDNINRAGIVKRGWKATTPELPYKRNTFAKRRLKRDEALSNTRFFEKLLGPEVRERQIDAAAKKSPGRGSGT